MRYLLDTHIFVWWILDHPNLSPDVKKIISNKENEIYLSAATTWEIVIKASIGKLVFPEEPAEFIKEQLTLNDFRILNVTIDHSFGVFQLPMLHKDPFDRLLIAQAKAENLVLITDDELIKQYSVDIL